jgi:hypothetical protein
MTGPKKERFPHGPEEKSFARLLFFSFQPVRFMARSAFHMTGPKKERFPHDRPQKGALSTWRLL